MGSRLTGRSRYGWGVPRFATLSAAVLLLFTGMVTLGSAPARAVVVDCSVDSLQAAIDGAVPGEILEVTAGTCSEFLVIAKDITIVGAGPGQTTIDGLGAPSVVEVRAFNGDPVVEIRDLTITGGNGGPGGGVRLVAGFLTLTNVWVQGNSAVNGGGIWSGATLWVQNSAVSGNTAASSGGGIYVVSDSVANLIDTLVSSNFAGDGVAGANPGDAGGGGGHGGGLYDGGGVVNVTRSSFLDNRAGSGGNGAAGLDGCPLLIGLDGGAGGPGGDGGAIWSAGHLDVDGSFLDGNRAGNGGRGGNGGCGGPDPIFPGIGWGGDGGNGGGGGDGGAIWAQGMALIEGTTIQNSAAGDGGDGGDGGRGESGVSGGDGGDGGAGGGGGGVFLAASTGGPFVGDSRIRGNSAGGGGGGGPGGSGTPGGQGGATGSPGRGGGLWNQASNVLLMEESTISGNDAPGPGGGLHDSGVATLVNVTVSGNLGGGNGGAAGVDSVGATSLVHSTVADNDGNLGGAVGGIAARGGSFGLNSSIVAGNSSPGPNDDCESSLTISSDGRNLFGYVPAGCLLSTAADLRAIHTFEVTPGGPLGDEVQSVTLNVLGGTFTLTFLGSTTSPIAFDASVTVVDSALEALPTIGIGNVAVTGPNGGPYTVTFIRALSNINVALLEADGSSLDVGLGPLRNNGGPGTQALAAASPAVDHIPTPCSVPTDARGVSRPVDAGCDIGAYEAGAMQTVILGGTGVVSAAVESSLTALTGMPPRRLAGADRYATAAAISNSGYPPGVSQVFIATGDNFPDALTGGPAAGAQGPILLVRTDSIPPVTAAELVRLKPAGITILGGTGVVSPTVEAQLAAYTSGTVTRLWGADRYATAAAISAATFAPGVPAAYIATGLNFPDALAGGPVAYQDRSPILLVAPNTIPAATANELTRLAPARIVILGGSGVVSPTVETQLAAYTSGSVTRLWGADRYATAAQISAASFPTRTGLAYIATGLNFPDALAGVPVAAMLDSPILLVGTDTIPTATLNELTRLR